MPDFLDMSHPEAATVAPVVAELGLRQEQVDRLIALRGELEAQATDRRSEAWAQQTRSSVPAHELTSAVALVRTHGTPELRAVLNETGLGNHPAIIRFLAAVQRGRSF
ncbi:MAG: hypothetical protein J0H19_04080 [Rhodospirillales bacterium]|nr:hypothetical protein [Rhodospirillales bacterium]